MRVKALRGVCIGVQKHLLPDDIADLEPGLVQYLVSIDAVVRLPDEEPAAPAAEPPADPQTETKSAKAGKSKEK